MNPIISREVRSRWRGLKAFGSVLAFATLLAFIIVLAYSDANLADKSINSLARRSGGSLFALLTCLQLGGLILFAPTLTATTIAGEREHGLLESLQLSPLTPLQIVTGKLASALLFLLLMLAVSLPVQAICLTMGGVSPLEFVLANLLSFTTCITCASVGITCSAWTRRGSIAFRSTFILIVVWSIGSAILWFTSFPGPTLWSMIWFWLARLAGLTNPILAAVSIVDPRAIPSSLPPPAAFSASTFIDYLYSMPLWVYCMATQVLGVAFMLWSSARALRRPLPEQYWIDPQQSSKKRKDATSGKSDAPQRTQRPGSSWWEVPVLSQLRFANPVLMREARGKFRMRQVPLWVIVFEVALALGVLVFYGHVLYWSIFEPRSRDVIWWGLTGIGFFVLTIAAPMMGAPAFTREREAGTWEGLVLSLLPARDIVFGKVAATLLTCVLLSIPVWPILFLCIRSLNSEPVNSGVSLVQALLILVVVSSTIWCYTMIGMTCSWYSKRTPIAVGWTIATLFGINVLWPFITSLLNYQGQDTLFKLTPVYALVTIGRMYDRYNTLDSLAALAVGISIFGHFIIGSILFDFLRQRLADGAREAR